MTRRAPKKWTFWPIYEETFEAVNSEESLLLEREGERRMQKKVCGREKKTDVFSGKGGTNEERKPRVPSCPPPSLPPPSMWDISAWVTLSYLGDKMVSLSSSLCLSPNFFLPLLLYVWSVTIAIQPVVSDVVVCCKRGLRLRPHLDISFLQ